MEVRAALQPGLRILVIDDEPFVLAVTVHVLQQLGFQQIATACDGADALRTMQAAALPFELVICDLNMPVMDGRDFMRKVSKLGYEGALIVLSSEEPQVLASAVALGNTCGLIMLGALSKPLDREQLVTMLTGYGGLTA